MAVVSVVVAATAAGPSGPWGTAEGQARVPICEVRYARDYTSWVDRFPITVETMEPRRAAEAIVQFLRPRSGRPDSLEAALARLADSGVRRDSAVSVELARIVHDGSQAERSVILHALGPLKLTLVPFIALVGDHQLSLWIRWMVFGALQLDAIQEERADSLTADATLASFCQLSGWLTGSSLEGEVSDPSRRLDVALTEDGGRLYLDLLRYVARNEEVFAKHTACASIPHCLGVADWVWRELARP